MVKVKVLADSISEEKVRLVTIEAEYPRIIHCELLTHRVFSRNSACRLHERNSESWILARHFRAVSGTISPGYSIALR